MHIVALCEGSAKCSNICPYYADSGVVRGCYDVPLKTHCRATMEPVIVDCEVYDPRKIQVLDVTEAEWAQMQEAIQKRARKIHKEYPDEQAEIHPVGWSWKHDPKGKWNADKSASARIVADRRTMDNRKKIK